jgi:monoamine oxidase
VKRREVLRNIGLGLSASWLASPLLSSCRKDDPGPEIPYEGTVAVIGAGAAGMYAADILNAKGIKVLILEASGQIGGRIRSLRNQTDFQSLFGQSTALEFGADFPIELGAEVYFGSNSIWGKSIRNLGLPTFELPSGSDRYILDTQVKTANEWSSDADFNSVQRFIQRLSNYNGPAQSVEQAAGVASRVSALLNAQAGNFFGSDSSKIGVQLLAEDIHARTHDAKALLLKANPMQDFFISRFNQLRSHINLGKPVTSINYSGDLVVIKDRNGDEYKVNKVIVTVPLAVLKSGNISFNPGLPAGNVSALNKFGMESSYRAVIDFRKNFWGDDASYFWGGTAAPQYLNAGLGRGELRRTLSFTINGSAAASLSAMNRDQQISAILSEMDTVYAGQASAFVRKDLSSNRIVAAIKDWTKDEYIKGGFSFPFVAATRTDRENLSKSVSNKIYFAGEAMDMDGNAGTINGALASAERVADEIIESIINP